MDRSRSRSMSLGTKRPDWTGLLNTIHSGLFEMMLTPEEGFTMKTCKKMVIMAKKISLIETVDTLDNA